MTLKQYVIDHVAPKEFYASRFKEWNPHVGGNVRCVFHDGDREPSLAIALKNGGARCHSSRCRKAIGNIVHFEAVRLGIKEPLAAKRLYREFIRPIVSKKKIAKFRENLMTTPEYILKIKKEMGLTLASMRKWSIGLDLQSHRITIPVYDQFGQCVNIRFYRLPSERGSDAAKLYNLKGYGRIDLFPWPVINEFPTVGPVYFMASEKEALLAIQGGLPAFTVTTGEGSWDPTWTQMFANRDVVLVFDRDAGGKEATERIGKLLPHSFPVRLQFNSERKDRKDFADWILKEKHEPRDLVKLARKVLPKRGKNTAVPSEGETDVAPEIDYPELPKLYSKNLVEVAAISSRVDLLNNRIRTQGIVAAKSPNTYSLPWKFRVTNKDKIKRDIQLPCSRELLRFVRASDVQILQQLQNITGSEIDRVEVVAHVTATECEIIPTAAAERDVQYVVQRCFYFGERIDSNIPYLLDVIPVAEIRTQETIGIITHAVPLSRSIDKFEMTPEIQADLSTFQPEDGDVWKKLTDVADEIAQRFTKIFNRLDWHLVALLTWCCPIGWRFPNETDLQRGWLNSLALGDTETGKSKVSKILKSIFNCGVFVNAENCTYVGLVGGAIKVGSGQLMLRWGRIPLSDKQLVILEEMSGLSVTEISNMSDVRSSGVARLDKGGINAETNSRTRLLCLSNVRSQRRNLSQYLFGVTAIQELIGHGEDIARFDLITTLVDREVSVDLINSSDRIDEAAQRESTIATDQLQRLVQFIWSLTPDKIHFTNDAYLECLEQTKSLSNRYHPSVPIFKGGAGRIKIARIAASIACFQFSWNNEEDRVEVTKSHVQAAARLLRLCYDKPSFGYFDYSRQMYDRETVKDQKLLTRAITERVSRKVLPKAIESLIHATKFTKDELCAVAGLNSMNADQLIGVLLRERAIQKGEANVWEITIAGKHYLERLMHKLQ